MITHHVLDEQENLKNRYILINFSSHDILKTHVLIESVEQQGKKAHQSYPSSLKSSRSSFFVLIIFIDEKHLTESEHLS